MPLTVSTHAAQIMDVQIMSRALSLSNAVRNRTVEDEAEATQELLGGDGTLATKQRARLGKLYTWGSGDYGRLGHGDNHSQKQPKLVEILREKDVRKFACGSRHVLALGSDGAVYSWGFGGDGQLGHGDLGIQTNPRLVKALHSEGVRDVCCGENHSVALTSGGDVFTWGEGAHGQLGLGDFRKQHTPRRVMELEGKMIVQITAGAYHTACIAEDHSVYCWGQGQSGRLGLGDEANTPTPTLVEGLTGCGIETIRAFGEHTMALTLPLETGAATDFDPRSRERMQQKVKELEVKLKQEKMAAHDAKEARNASRSKLVESEQNVDRLKRQNEALLQERVELYMKMQNLDNQLSVVTAEKDNLDHELMSLVAMPTKLAEITAQGVRQIACGLHHVLALSDAGDVYAWGGGGAGQLGLGRRKSFPAPQLVWGMMRKGVRQIGAGAKHSAALTYNGLVYTWGSSSHGQLGHGNKRTQLQPKLCEALEAECRERSSTARLLGCGSKHTVAVLGNGSLYMWGRADFGKLGRSKSDAQTEPFLIEALWRREVAAGSTDKTKSLSKAEISELLEQRLDVHDILRYFPDIEADAEAALFLSKAVAADLHKRNTQLQADLEQARKDNEKALEKFIADQERAFEEKEKEGLEKLQRERAELEAQLQMHEKSSYFQGQVATTLREELAELELQIKQSEATEEKALAQAHTSQKATLHRALHAALESLKQARDDKEHELLTATRQAALAQEELEKVQRDLSLTRVEIKKHEKLGFKKSINHLNSLVAEMSALSQRLNETSLENIDPTALDASTTNDGIRRLIRISNEDIDRICTQAATFASNDHVDVSVRQQLATMLFDNAEMRKQLNAYTEGILMQTMERLDQLGANDSSKQLAGPMGGMALPDAKQIAGVTGAVSGLLKGPSQKV